MWKELLPALRIKLLMTVLVAVVYPLSITGVFHLKFPHRANGSLITAGGKVIGSELIGLNYCLAHGGPGSAFVRRAAGQRAQSQSDVGPARQQQTIKTTGTPRARSYW